MAYSDAIEDELIRLRWDHAWLKMKVALLKAEIALKAYNPHQPRVPAGNGDESGEWTRDFLNATRVASSSRGRSAHPIAVQFPGATPAQIEIYAATSAMARAAIARVQERDPAWKPTPSIYQTVEGAIRARDSELAEALARLRELQRYGIGPGPYAGESIPARGPGRNFSEQERIQNDRNGRTTGCHTCGTKDPGTPSGRFVRDHHLPSG